MLRSGRPGPEYKTIDELAEMMGVHRAQAGRIANQMHADGKLTMQIGRGPTGHRLKYFAPIAPKSRRD